MCVFMYDVISVTWSCRYRGLTGGRSGIRRESVGELHGTELYGTVHRERKDYTFTQVNLKFLMTYVFPNAQLACFTFTILFLSFEFVG